MLGADGVGTYSYSFSLVSVFGVFALLGTSVYGQQIISQCRDDEYVRSKSFWEIELICIGTTIVVIICWLLFVFGFEERSIYYIILTLNLVSIGADISWYYTGLEDFSIIILMNFIVRILMVISIFMFVKTEEDLVIYFLIQSIGQLVSSITLWLPLKSTVIKVTFTEMRFKEHLKQTLVYFIPTVAASVYQYIDKTMIGVITQTKVENAYYEQAQKILDMAYTVVASINTVMASRVAYLFAKEDYDEIRKRYIQSARFIGLLSYPMMIGLFVVAEDFVPWFFGDGYDGVVSVIRLGCPFIIINSLHNFLAAQHLVPSGQRAKSTYGVVVGAIACLTPY